MNAHAICDALGGRWHGSYGLAFCPVHKNTRTPALSLKDGDDGRLTAWEANFVASLDRQATRPRWRLSPRQATVIRRLHAALANAEATLIHNHDTGDACPAPGGRATEFLEPEPHRPPRVPR